LLVTSVLLLAGCGNPQQSTQACVGTADDVMQAIQEQVDDNQTVRNGRMVRLRDAEYAFISAELHPSSDDPHDSGDIGTWATRDVASPGDFLAVDVHAREESTWPAAPFDVTAEGAIESRACTALSRGKTPEQVACERARASGQIADLPDDQDCSDL
jgi:hypothetical protein